MKSCLLDYSILHEVLNEFRDKIRNTSNVLYVLNVEHARGKGSAVTVQEKTDFPDGLLPSVFFGRYITSVSLKLFIFTTFFIKCCTSIIHVTNVV